MADTDLRITRSEKNVIIWMVQQVPPDMTKPLRGNGDDGIVEISQLS
jgi:hypothetical protein